MIVSYSIINCAVKKEKRFIIKKGYVTRVIEELFNDHENMHSKISDCGKNLFYNDYEFKYNVVFRCD